MTKYGYQPLEQSQNRKLPSLNIGRFVRDKESYAKRGIAKSFNDIQSKLVTDTNLEELSTTIRKTTRALKEIAATKPTGATRQRSTLPMVKEAVKALIKKAQEIAVDATLPIEQRKTAVTVATTLFDALDIQYNTDTHSSSFLIPRKGAPSSCMAGDLKAIREEILQTIEETGTPQNSKPQSISELKEQPEGAFNEHLNKLANELMQERFKGDPLATIAVKKLFIDQVRAHLIYKRSYPDYKKIAPEIETKTFGRVL